MTFLVFVFPFLFVIAIFLTVQYSLFIPPVKGGIPIFMYHQVKPLENNRLCISSEKIESQFLFLIKNGYTCLRLDELLNSGQVLPEKSYVLTFDDAYENNLEHVYPLLVKYKLHATIMLPVKFLGSYNEWDGSHEKILSVQQLKSMNPIHISFGLHSYHHQNLRHASPEIVGSEIQDSVSFLAENKIDFLPVFAYPYGGYPREKEPMKVFFNVLKKNGIKLGLKIGNRINPWPLKNSCLVERIDIRGTDSMWEFKTKLRKGRVKMF